jgi:hypothetical protein
VILAAAPFLMAADAPPAMDNAAFKKAVQEEVARQLPGLVAKELKIQLDAMVQAERERRDQLNLRLRGVSISSMVQTMRSQLELYKIQHNDVPPSFDELKDWNVLLNKTGFDGKVDANGRLGPYIQAPPVNPYTQSSKVVPTGQASDDAGWTYSAKDGKYDLKAVMPHKDAPSGIDISMYEIVKPAK